VGVGGGGCYRLLRVPPPPPRTRRNGTNHSTISRVNTDPDQTAAISLGLQRNNFAFDTREGVSIARIRPNILAHERSLKPKLH